MAFEAVEVTARFDTKGRAHPEKFLWNGAAYPIATSGRRWDDLDGKHILVMDFQAQVYELIFVPDEMRWFLNKAARVEKLALTA